jgi:hypothetical protein
MLSTRFLVISCWSASASGQLLGGDRLRLPHCDYHERLLPMRIMRCGISPMRFVGVPQSAVVTQSSAR